LPCDSAGPQEGRRSLMAKNPNQRAGSFESENTGGLLTGLLAEEEHFDRRALFRLGTWGAASVGAVIVGLLANQSSTRSRHDDAAAADLARQSQLIQSVAKEGQNETRRLASAIDTLNGDRDRLYSRITVLEQGLDSVTGAIAKQKVAATSPQAAPTSTPSAPPAISSSPAVSAPAVTAPPQPVAENPVPPPVIAPVATAVAAAEKPKADAKPPEPSPAALASAGQAVPTSSAPTPATLLVASKSMMAPPDAAAGKPVEPEPPAKAAVTAASAPVPALAPVLAPVPAPQTIASVPPATGTEPDAVKAMPPKLSVQRTEFGVDVGGANSIGGLRALWRGLLKSRSNAPLAVLHPIIVVKEGSNGLGMQLRLVAGPLDDAATAARICAVMNENGRLCETTMFDGQRLAMKADDAAASADSTLAKPESTKPEPTKSESTKSDPNSSDPTKSASATSPSSARPISTRQYSHRRSYPKKPVPVVAEPKKPEPTTLSSFFGRR
jgi:hypothetical protein